MSTTSNNSSAPETRSIPIPPYSYTPRRVPPGWVAMDPHKTDSILGVTYGMKRAPVVEPKPEPEVNPYADLDLNEEPYNENFDEEMEERLEDLCLTFGKKVKESSTTLGRIQPHPYTAANHPAHAARAKWLQDYEDGKISLAQPAHPFRTPVRRGPQYGSPGSAGRPTNAGPPLYAPRPQTPQAQVPYRPAGGYQLVTPPRSTKPQRQALSQLSPFAQPFVPRTPQKEWD